MSVWVVKGNKGQSCKSKHTNFHRRDAKAQSGSAVHTMVDDSLQEAWAKTPTGKKRETTHIVRSETEILRVREIKD